MPPTLLEILRRTEAFFEKAGLEKPRLDAEWLMAAVLQCKRLELYLQFDRPLTPELLDRLRPLVRRRAQREPLQYILGETDFGDLRLRIDRRALIPRPETEALVERLVALPQDSTPRRILDLGTGSGAIALGLAQAWPEAEVTAVDASAEALALARENAKLNQLETRVNFLEGSWFGPLPGQRFDLIVSNPPYLTRSEWEEAQPEVREYEPSVALVAEEDGLADLRQLMQAAPGHLEAKGVLALETGIDQHARLAEQAASTGFARWESAVDDTGRDRYFFAWMP